MDETWKLNPVAIEIWPNLYLGNVLAAMQARQSDFPFKAILNVAEELNLPIPNEMQYHKIPLRDGAENPIAKGNIAAAITWLAVQLDQGKKVLVHCKAGIGRSASIVVAYVYWKNPTWSYTEVVEYVRSKKPNVFPHAELKRALEVLYPNPNRPGIRAKSLRILEPKDRYLLFKEKDEFFMRVEAIAETYGNWQQKATLAVEIRTDMWNDPWQNIPLTPVGPNIYEIRFPLSKCGSFWVTASACHYSNAIEQERVWLGHNINFDVQK